MSNNLQTYTFQAHELRIIPDENGAPWFIAQDICAILGYGNAARTINQLCRKSGITNRYIPTLSNNYTLIDEGNLYRLIIKSTKPESEPFEAWVCDEVLPAIRKTGSYDTPGYTQPITTPLTLAEFQQRHDFLSNALAALLKAPVIMTGQDALAITRNNTKPKGTYLDYRNDWTAEEIEKLITMTAQGMARTEIYRQMPSRTTQAIGKKINLLIRQGKLTVAIKAGV